MVAGAVIPLALNFIVSWRKLQPSARCVVAPLYRSSHGLWLPPDRPGQSPNGLLFDGIGWRQHLPNKPDCPYHSDTKVILPKCAFGVIMLSSLWPTHQVYFPLKLRRCVARDPVTSFKKPVFFNRTTCKVVTPALTTFHMFLLYFTLYCRAFKNRK